jgi:hypothetical protein
MPLPPWAVRAGGAGASWGRPGRVKGHPASRRCPKGARPSPACAQQPPHATIAPLSCTPLPPPGARDTIYHDPRHVTAAIVTCGGLCPGLNDVVAGLVNKLTDYGVPEGNILGIRYGFRWGLERAAACPARPYGG